MWAADGSDCYLRVVSGSAIASSLLVAMPQLEDPNFHRCVVQIVHHDEEGAFGLVLNRPSGVAAGQLCDSLEIEWGGDPDAEVGSGGPVQPNTGWLLFGEGAPDDLPDTTPIVEGVHFAGSLETLRRIGAEPPERVRLFLGYAGWGPGQLEMELAQGAWLLVPASAEVAFAPCEDELWLRVIRDLGVDPATLISTPGVH